MRRGGQHQDIVIVTDNLMGMDIKVNLVTEMLEWNR